MTVEKIPCDVARTCCRSRLDAPRAGRRQAACRSRSNSSAKSREVVQTDPLRLKQVLMNLTGNAIKFTEQGEVCVNMSVEKRGDGSRVRFDVRDTGIGMPTAADRPALPAVRPGRRFHDAQVRRHRAGPGHQQTPGHLHGRRSHRQFRNRPRQHIHPERRRRIARRHPHAPRTHRIDARRLRPARFARRNGPPRSNPAGRGRDRQSASADDAPDHGRCGSGRRPQRPRSRRTRQIRTVRSGPDGHADARTGRLRGHRATPPAGI